jgi:response regulator RpfG family c-di-GMP phosphodiesterase
MQGVSLAISEQPDAIITDIRMPQGEGDHVVACLKRQAETRHIPIVVLTGQKDADLELRMRQLGVQQYLKKPVSWSELEEALFEVLKLPKIDDAHERIRPHLGR